jgi:prevent-host-death family protein
VFLMVTFTVHQAKSSLSKLMARAEAGEEIVIARREKPAVRLVPVEEGKKKPRTPGALAHLRGKLPDNLFLEPLPEDELQAWEGKYSFDPGR